LQVSHSVFGNAWFDVVYADPTLASEPRCLLSKLHEGWRLKTVVSLPLAWTAFGLRTVADRKAMHSDQTSIAPGGSHILGHQADMLIKPEQQNGNNWTKVLTDTFVWSNSRRDLCATRNDGPGAAFAFSILFDLGPQIDSAPWPRSQFPCIEAKPIPKYNRGFRADGASCLPECRHKQGFIKTFGCVVDLFSRSTFPSRSWNAS